MDILVIVPVSEKHKKILEGVAPGAAFGYAPPDDVRLVGKQVHDADIIIGNPPVEMIKGSKRLKFLQLESAGANPYVQPGVLPESTILARAGAYGLALSECMVGTILELFKKLHLYRDNQTQAIWRDMGSVQSIYCSTALIVGLGEIGSELAKRLKALGAYTIGVKRTHSPIPPFMDELHTIEALEALLPRADIIALALPETNHTRKIINENTLRLMKKNAVVINAGRGSAVDTEALCDALESGRIWGAALDVTDPQPLPANHRLWGLKNAIVTPHVFGGLHLQQTHEQIVQIAAANLDAFLHGGKVSYTVDMSAGY